MIVQYDNRCAHLLSLTYMLFLWLSACLQGSFRILKHAPAAQISHKCNSSAKISLRPGWLENFPTCFLYLFFVSQFVFASRSTHRTKEISCPSPQKELLPTSSSLTRSSIWLWWTSSVESPHCPSQRWEMPVLISKLCVSLYQKISDKIAPVYFNKLTSSSWWKGSCIYPFLPFWLLGACPLGVLGHINCLLFGFTRWESSRSDPLEIRQTSLWTLPRCLILLLPCWRTFIEFLHFQAAGEAKALVRSPFSSE